MREHPEAGEMIEDLFHSRVFLFLGASLEGIESDFGRLTIEEPPGGRHFALVPDTGEDWKAPARRLKVRYGIEALTYTPSTDDHPELVEFLTKTYAVVPTGSESDHVDVDAELALLLWSEPEV